ncbi:hypothetical protein B6D52_02220 [Candidatus Parcubacteria bacterium 4484_255]|nr:MAG: hypothetical protein B6D52_02220 [Candidatus Parcubacteria bacterium 4484_255]
MTGLTDKQLRYAKLYLRHKNMIRNIFAAALILLNAGLIAIIVRQSVFYFNLKEESLENMQELAENRINFLSLHNEHFLPQSIVTDSLIVVRPDPAELQYDFIITAFNPNLDWRADIEYYFSMDNGMKSSPGSGFINPGEKKYLFVLGESTDSEVSDARFLISDISWRRVRQSEKHLLSILDQLTIEDIDLEYLQEKNKSLVLPQISFKAKNNSVYSFRKIPFVIALERNLSLVGLNILFVDAWRAGEEKNLAFVWPLIPQFTRIKITPEIDVLNPDAFISPL